MVSFLDELREKLTMVLLEYLVMFTRYLVIVCPPTPCLGLRKKYGVSILYYFFFPWKNREFRRKPTQIFKLLVEASIACDAKLGRAWQHPHNGQITSRASGSSPAAAPVCSTDPTQGTCATVDHAGYAVIPLPSGMTTWATPVVDHPDQEYTYPAWQIWIIK